MHTVVFLSAGWTSKQAATFQDLPGILRVDLNEMLPDGRFRQLVIHFDTQARALNFTQLASKHFGIDYEARLLW